MEDPEVVVAIVAGDPAGLAEAYDRYAVPLYSYCRSMLREPADAADAVQDTFLVAAAKLHGLREPSELRAWLYTLARNECLRQLRAGTVHAALEEAADLPAQNAEAGVATGRADLQALVVTATDGLSPGFREQVLRILADRSPAGIAHRLTVANRAGPFGSNGFPKPLSPPATGPWRRVLGHPRATVAGAATSVMAAGAIAAVVIAVPHQGSPSAGASGGSTHGASTGRTGPSSARGSGPSRDPGDSGNRQAPAGSTPRGMTSPLAFRSSGAPGRAGGTPGSSPPGGGSPSSGGSSGGSSSGGSSSGGSSSGGSSSGSSSSSAPASAGTLSASTGTLDLVAVNGIATGSFTLTARGGPVSSYSIAVGSTLAGSLSVSPSSGSLASGASVTITVTSRSLVALDGHLTVQPGGRTITVVLSIGL